MPLSILFKYCKESGDTILLELGVVIVIEVVDADDRRAFLEQATGDGESDKTGNASHENRSCGRKL